MKGAPDCMECRGEGTVWSRLLQLDVACECTDDSGDDYYEALRDME